MRSFILTRGQNRKCTYNALRVIERPGNQPNGIEQVTLFFAPGRFTEVADDLNVQPIVDDGFIVEIRQAAPRPVKVVEPVVEKPVIPPVVVIPVVEKVVEEPVEEPKEADKPLVVDVGIMTATVDPGDDGELGTDDDVVTIKPNVKEEVLDDGDEYVDEEDDYEEMEDGRFRCLICMRAGEEKILRSENGMIAHIEKKH